MAKLGKSFKGRPGGLVFEKPAATAPATKAKKKKPTLEKAPLGALKTADKKSELAPIGATSPTMAKKEPKRAGGDEADRPPSRTVWKSNARWRGFTSMPTQVAHAQQARGGGLRFR